MAYSSKFTKIVWKERERWRERERGERECERGTWGGSVREGECERETRSSQKERETETETEADKYNHDGYLKTPLQILDDNISYCVAVCMLNLVTVDHHVVVVILLVLQVHVRIVSPPLKHPCYMGINIACFTGARQDSVTSPHAPLLHGHQHCLFYRCTSG